MKFAKTTQLFALGLLVAWAPSRAQALADAGAVPPWAVESPGAAGAPLAVGLDFATARDAGLHISAQSSVVTLQDLATGTTQTYTVPGDPALLNRKFSIRISSTGEGAQLPIALPKIPLAGVGIYPSLILQGASNDLSLGFTDRPEPADSTALAGRAAVYGIGVALAAPLCRGCPWFATVGYRVSLLPGLTGQRSPGFDAPGFAVLQNRSEFRLRADQGLLRIGRGLPGGRAAVYLGLLRGRELVTDDDVLQLGSSQVGQQMLISSRTRFAAETTAGLAGVESRLVGPLMLRLETVFGSGQSGAALKLAWLDLPKPGHQAGAPPGGPAGGGVGGGPLPGRQDAVQDRIAVRILPRLQEIRGELARRLARLPPGPAGPALVAAAAVAQLLDDIEQELLQTLAAPELLALRGSVQDLFRRARLDLSLASSAKIGPAPSTPVPASYRRAPPPAGRGLDAQKTAFWFCKIDALVATIETWARKRELQFDLAVESEPDHARFSMVPYSYRGHPAETYRTDGAQTVIEGVWRGRYEYTVALGKDFSPGQGELDLVQGSPRRLLCHLAPSAAADDTSSCDPRGRETEEECKR